jgi:hypothetical protein
MPTTPEAGEASDTVQLPEALPAGLSLPASPETLAPQPTLVLDWDRERTTGVVPRHVPLALDEAGPSWVTLPHAKYVVSARHRRGRIEHVYVTSLLGKRDSLIPAGVVERVVTDAGSVAIVVDGRPYLYVVDAGTTLDVVARRALGAS